MRLPLSVAVLALGLVAPASPQDIGLPAPLEMVGELRLEETASVFVARPRLAPDPTGGWIYWDGQSDDARLYTPDGRLKATFGRPGEGPGEFQGLVSVVRLGDERLVALDGRGRLSTWTEAGDSLISDVASGIASPIGMVAVGQSDLLLYASPRASDAGGGRAPIVYRFNVSDPSDASVLLGVDLTPEQIGMVGSLSSPPPILDGDSIAIVVAPFDSIWVADVSGSGHRTLNIPSQALADSPEPVTPSEGGAAFFGWVQSARFPGHFGRMPNGDWIVYTWGSPTDEDPHRGLVRFRADGTRVWEVADRWVLLATDPDSGQIYLWDPEGTDPARVIVAR